MLKDKLTAIGAASAGKVPPDIQAIMKQAKENIAASGIMERTIKPGEKVPDFFLEDADGRQVDMVELRRHGPVMMTIYRGIW